MMETIRNPSTDIGFLWCAFTDSECRLAINGRTAIICNMSGSPAVYSPDSMRAEKRAVAGSSVLAAMAMTLLKIVVALTTGSLGILSEAAHSGLDLIAAIITFFSVRVSDLPADADHQYGHGKEIGRASCRERVFITV